MNYDNAVAVIGLSARAPGASDLAQFWRNLCAGETAFTEISDEALKAQGIHDKFLAQDDYVKVGVGIEDVDKFDASFFDIPAREACVLDPQQRIFLEGCWEALENAGYATEQAERSVGVFAGASMNSYWMRNLGCQPEYVSSNAGFQALLGNDKDYLATRVAYKLNLQGPAVTVQTACSTSLVAVHMACQNILLGECDMALAGGVSIKVPQDAGYFYQDGMPFSKDGQCQVFDKDGSGTIFGSGMGVVLLKAYDQAIADNDNILAVIRGSAFNNDGNRKVGFTAPSSEGQVAAIKRALTVAEVDAHSISYIETHGTGTNLGDPIEFQGIQSVYGNGDMPCFIGALKGSVGHLETAAGIVGLIKTVLMLQHKQIPPLANFKELNPLIEADGTRFRFNTTEQPWDADFPRRAGVSSFGMGGTNSHIVLEEAPAPGVDTVSADLTREIVTLSAKSASSLEQMSANLLQWLEHNQDANFHHVCASLQTHRQDFSHRRSFLASSVEQAIDILKNHPEQQLTMSSPQRDSLVFLFPGAGAQYVNMGRDLYRSNATYAAALDRCLDRFESLLGLSLRDYLDSAPQNTDALMQAMQAPNLMFPLTFSFQYALTQLLADWQLQPQACLGHSHGEYIIAHLAGVMDFETVTLLVAKRAELMMKLQPGQMLVVPHSAEQVATVVADMPISFGAKNSAKNTVLSGSTEQVADAKRKLDAQLGGDIKALHIDAGLHSHLIDAIYDEFLAVVAQCQLHAPKIDWVSSISGEWVNEATVTQSQYWADHMRNTVEFVTASTTMMEKYPNAVFLDLGPNQVVGELLRENHADKNPSVVPFARSLRQAVPDTAVLQEALSRLWLCGYTLDWCALNPEPVRPLPLPTYAFDRRSYWVEYNQDPDDALRFESLSFSSDTQESSDSSEQGNRPNLMTPFVAPATSTEEKVAQIWRQFFGIAPLGIYDNFIELGGTSLLATEVIGDINRVLKCKITLSNFLAAGNIHKAAELVEQWHEEHELKLKLEILDMLETV
ncbi:polyketide synthase [Pseudoalteromonas rubra]|uniref:Polyketide synthase n=1 Tax=Pseudoalteromonas rubra TaxID=43658 RepID=A0A4Q7ELJ9_9GAMM|nr:type I polyketide synthase [Pseudoalteromonas rubra]RZM85208.1 polyketide synthase [Pseudoalteromonas rubra]